LDLNDIEPEHNGEMIAEISDARTMRFSLSLSLSLSRAREIERCERQAEQTDSPGARSISCIGEEGTSERVVRGLRAIRAICARSA
jgi:hypothetical protein